MRVKIKETGEELELDDKDPARAQQTLSTYAHSLMELQKLEAEGKERVYQEIDPQEPVPPGWIKWGAVTREGVSKIVIYKDQPKAPPPTEVSLKDLVSG